VWPSIITSLPATGGGEAAFTAVFVGLILMASTTAFALAGAISHR
jgi:hypothetical protein